MQVPEVFLATLKVAMLAMPYMTLGSWGGICCPGCLRSLQNAQGVWEDCRREARWQTDLCMANVEIAIWLWRKSGDHFATCCFEMLGQLLSRVAQVPLPAITEGHSCHNLHTTTILEPLKWLLT